MQNYQSYYPFNTNYQPAQQNPYMQRMEYLQQYQQNLQPQVTQPQMSNQLPALGKIVESIDIVKATDIPMDGNMYYFPTADGSVVYGKQWMSNGQTRILPFKPILESETENASSSCEKLDLEENRRILEGILTDLQLLNEKVDRMAKPNTTTKTKKESATDE